MLMGPMITNGGPHPADKWADVTTETILNLIQVKEDSVTPEATAARATKRSMRTALFDIFNGHHDGVQKVEQELTKSVETVEHAAEHVAATLNPMPHVDPTFEKVKAVLAATPFAAHFAKEEVQAILQNIIGQHTADVMHIERRWHQDRLNAAKGA